MTPSLRTGIVALSLTLLFSGAAAAGAPPIPKIFWNNHEPPEIRYFATGRGDCPVGSIKLDGRLVRGRAYELFDDPGLKQRPDLKLPDLTKWPGLHGGKVAACATLPTVSLPDRIIGEVKWKHCYEGTIPANGQRVSWWGTRSPEANLLSILGDKWGRLMM